MKNSLRIYVAFLVFTILQPGFAQVLKKEKSLKASNQYSVDIAGGKSFSGNKLKTHQIKYKQKKNYLYSIGATKKLDENLFFQLKFISSPNSKAKAFYSQNVADFSVEAKYSNYTLLGGLKYKFFEKDKFSFFANGLFGGSYNKLTVVGKEIESNATSTTYQDSKKSLSYGVGLEGQYKINDKFSTTLGYHYFDFGKFQTSPYSISSGTITRDKPHKFSVRTHSILVGINYKI